MPASPRRDSLKTGKNARFWKIPCYSPFSAYIGPNHQANSTTYSRFPVPTKTENFSTGNRDGIFAFGFHIAHFHATPHQKCLQFQSYHKNSIMTIIITSCYYKIRQRIVLAGIGECAAPRTRLPFSGRTGRISKERNPPFTGDGGLRG